MANSFTHYQDAFKNTHILRPPKQVLSTFGGTTLRYILLSPIDGDTALCRVREGSVTASRPKILTPDFWKNRFEGFGDESDKLRPFAEQTYGDAFRSLEYGFKNDLKSTSTETSGMQAVEERVRRVMTDEDWLRTGLVRGHDALWSISILRFILDMSIRSFPSNVRELDERGLFNPERHADQKLRAKIETLFSRAATDSASLKELGQLLRSAGLFSEYEDRFFALIAPKR
jgi:hypothetical protein